MKDKSAFYDKIERFINPIAVKELRQIVRGYFFAVVYACILLLLLWALKNVFYSSRYYNQASGSNLKFMLYLLPSIICGFFIPLLYGFKFGAERANKTEELVYTTALSAKQIISGKLISAVLIDLLLLSVFAPFICASLFLKGVNYDFIILNLINVFVISFFLLTVQIFFASLVTSKASYNFYRLFGFLAHIYIYYAVFSIFVIEKSTRSVFMPGRSFIQDTFASSLIAFGVVLALAFFIQRLAAAVISTADKSPVKAKFVDMGFLGSSYCFLLLGKLFNFFITGANLIEELTNMWVSIGGGMLVWLAFAFSSENSELTEQEIEEIPRGRFRQILHFVLHKGSAGTAIFGVIMCLCIAAGFLVISDWPIEQSGAAVALFFIAAGALAASFALFACLLRRTVLKGKIPVRHTHFLALALAAAAVGLHSFVEYSFKVDFFNFISVVGIFQTVKASCRSVYVGPYGIAAPGLNILLVRLALFFIIGALANASWFKQQIKSYAEAAEAKFKNNKTPNNAA